MIHIGCPIPFDTDEFLQQLQMLLDAAYDGRDEDIRQLVAKVVPTYCPAGVPKAEANKEELAGASI